MFLDLLARRNPGLLDAAVGLHQAGLLPANCFVLDLDAIRANATVIRAEADRLGLTVYAMTKQLGRNPDACRAIIAGGIGAAVAVDMADARATTAAGMRLGHLGHLVQVPRAEAAAAASMQPEHWTVFSLDKAAEAAAAARAAGYEQPLLARIQQPDDEFYPGHEGGFEADSIAEVADRIDALDGARFAGITTFPALVFDPAAGSLRATRNLATLQQAKTALRAAGREHSEVNGPGTTSTVALARLAEAGVTQVEPGHALTGTTPLHATDDLPELPAICYLSEVSHRHRDRGYFFGGGLYVDPVFPPYPVQALVGDEPGALRRLPAELPPPAAIDYYGQLDLAGAGPVPAGTSVLLGFRAQAFVTRAYTAGVVGVQSGQPRVAGIWSADGSAACWPGAGA